MPIGYLQLDTVQGGKLDNDLILEVVNLFDFFNVGDMLGQFGHI